MKKKEEKKSNHVSDESRLAKSFYSVAAASAAVYMEVLANFPDENPALLSRIRHSGSEEIGEQLHSDVCIHEKKGENNLQKKQSFRLKFRDQLRNMIEMREEQSGFRLVIVISFVNPYPRFFLKNNIMKYLLYIHTRIRVYVYTRIWTLCAANTCITLNFFFICSIQPIK